MRRIIVNAELCDGCMQCVEACERHLYPESRPQASQGESGHSACYILQDAQGRYVPAFCHQCADAVCRTTCMSGAIYPDAQSGTLRYNREQCAACFMCVMNCPYGMPKPEEDTMASVIRCDGCAGREVPACVALCSRGALDFLEVER